jgi:general secretion pathway protein D
MWKWDVHVSVLVLCCAAPSILAGDVQANCADLAEVMGAFGKRKAPGTNVNAGDAAVDIRRLAAVARRLDVAAHCLGSVPALAVPSASVMSKRQAAVGSATIAVTGPASITMINQTFNVAIQATTITDLYAFQFDVSFDPALLSASLVSQGSFLSGGGVTIFIPGTIDNTTGHITFVGSTLTGPIAGVTGSGTLGSITFTAKAPGVSQVSLSDLILLDSALNSITAGIQNGSVLIGAPVPSGLPAPPSLLLFVTGLVIVAFLSRLHEHARTS